jgi:hypothetical protein
MLKAKDTGLSKNWTVIKRQGAVYTGGLISVARDGFTSACMCNNRVAIVDLRTGAVNKFLPPEVRSFRMFLAVLLIAESLCSSSPPLARRVSMKSPSALSR